MYLSAYIHKCSKKVCNAFYHLFYKIPFPVGMEIHMPCSFFLKYFFTIIVIAVFLCTVYWC